MVSAQNPGSARAASYILRILHYLIAAAIIVNQNSIWRFLKPVSERFDDYVLIILLVLIAGSMILKMKLQPAVRTSKDIVTAAFVLMYMTVLMIINYFFPYYYMEFAVSAFALGMYFLMCSDRTAPEVLTAYRNIVLVIAAVSVVLWLFGSILHLIPPTGTVLTSWNSEGGYVEVSSYLGIYFETQKFYLFGPQFFRNSACFAEAPMASLAFTFGMLIDLFLRKKSEPGKGIEKAVIIRSAVFLAAVITTCSATGIILCVAAIVVMFLMNHIIPKIKAVSDKTGKRRIIIGIICVAAVIGGGLLYIFLFKMDTYSGNVRVDDFKAGVKAWLDAPVIGNGFMNDNAIVAHMGDWRQDNYGFSNSVLQILAHGGIYLGILYIIPLIAGIVRSIRARRWPMLCFILCTLVLLCMAIFSYSYMIIFLLYFFAFGGNAEAKTGI